MIGKEDLRFTAIKLGLVRTLSFCCLSFPQKSHRLEERRNFMRIVLGQQRDENKQTEKAFLTRGEESIPEAVVCMEKEGLSLSLVPRSDPAVGTRWMDAIHRVLQDSPGKSQSSFN